MMMSFKRTLIPVVAIGGLLLMVVWMAGFFDQKIQPGLTPLDKVAVDATDVATVRQRAVNLVEPVPASIAAKYATLVSSRILARITTLNVRAGDMVSKGQTLIELEKSDLLAKTRQARENIKAVDARLTEAKQNLARVEALNQQGLVALADVDRARANYAALTAELALAQQQREEAETALSYTQISSPIDGRVVDRFAEPGDTASPGTPLLSLYNPLALRVEAHVREKLALSLTLGQSVEVDIPSLNKTVSAQIDEIVPAADTGSRSFLVKARVAFQKEMLPGMYARLLLPAGVEGRLVIAHDRVVQVGQQDMVWLLKEGQVYRRFVRLGKTLPEGDVEVLAGLSEGDQLIMPPISAAQ